MIGKTPDEENKSALLAMCFLGIGEMLGAIFNGFC
jgi:hypothetical protein